MGKLLSSTALNRLSSFAGLKIAVEYVPVARLKQPPRATRRHPQQQIRRIARSIAEHGFLVPVTVYADYVIASGAARVATAGVAGLSEVPVIRIEHLTDEQARLAYFAARAAAGGDIDRLIVNLPPRSAKSTLIAVALPAFVLGRDPTKRVIVVSYNQSLANGFSRQTRQVVHSAWYRELFPIRSSPTARPRNSFSRRRAAFAWPPPPVAR